MLLGQLFKTRAAKVNLLGSFILYFSFMCVCVWCIHMCAHVGGGGKSQRSTKVSPMIVHIILELGSFSLNQGLIISPRLVG